MNSGDGWTTCELGHRHWGLFGAAGLLVIRDADVLLHLRSEHTHNGNTWSVPGGARDVGETAADAALREAREEVGIEEDDVAIFGYNVDDHGGWAYTTALARLLRPRTLQLNFESAEARWVAIADVEKLPLHPGFATSWSSVSAAIGSMHRPAEI